MKGNKRLLISPPPFFDESFEGYIARLTTLNHYESIRWIYENAKLISSNYRIPLICLSSEDYNLQYLSEFTGVSEKILWDLTFYNQFGKLKNLESKHYIDKFLLSFAIHGWKSKVCPLCLNEKNYIRKLWSLSIYNVCHLHSCKLIKDCPKCGIEINISNIPLSSCICGHHLYSKEAIKFSNINKSVEYFLYSKLYYPEGLARYENNCLVNLDFKLVVFLILYFTRKIDNATETQKHFISTQSSFNIFNDWKVNFIAFLDQYRNQPKSRYFTGLQKEFGRLNIEILDKFKNASPDHLEFIISAFEEYLSEKWDGGYLPETFANKFKLERKWFSKNEVVKLLRIAPLTLDKLIETGVISARELNTAERKMVLIHRDQVNNYIKESRKKLTLQETRVKLGISEHSILKLLKGGLLKGEYRLTNKKSWSIDADSVNKILETLDSKVQKGVSFSLECLISFQESIRIANREHKDILYFISQVFQNKIIHIFLEENNTGLKKYYFLKDEVMKVMGD